MQSPCTEIKGFSYFSALESVDIDDTIFIGKNENEAGEILPACREVVVRNCSKLELIELTWCDKLVCQNCPELQTIEILGDGTADVMTEGCPNITSIITNEDDVCHCE